MRGKSPAKPHLALAASLGSGSPTANAPPRSLGEPGSRLWHAITSNYCIDDEGGRELLCGACQMLDRAEALRSQIDADGEIIRTKTGIPDHPALRHEIAARSYIARTLARLGLEFEPLRPTPGRPPVVY